MVISLAPSLAFADDWGSWDAPLDQANDLDASFERDLDLEDFDQEDHDLNQYADQGDDDDEEYGVGLEGEDERYLSELDGSSLHDEDNWDDDHDRHGWDDRDDDWEQAGGRWEGVPDHEEEYWETIEHPFTAFEDDYGEDFDDDDFESGGHFEPGEFPGHNGPFHHRNHIIFTSVTDK